MADTPYEFELLCTHHALVDFNSGSANHDDTVRDFQSRVRALELELGGTIVVATTRDGDVAGVIGTVDFEIVEDAQFGGEGANRPAEGLWLYYQLVLVRVEYQGTRLVGDLLEKVEQIAQRKLEANSEYLGELASPRVARADYEDAKQVAEQGAREPPKSNSLERYLLRRGFRPIDDDPLSWLYRPRKRRSSTEPVDT